MGSRIMHLIIADRVCKKLAIKNKELFLLGGIAPDAAYTAKRKTASHFYEGSLDDGTKFVNYARFIEKYQTDIQDEYVLGYLTHLVSDDVWLKQIYFKNNFKNRLDADSGLLERWHSDFRKLNGKLVEWFACSSLREELTDSSLLNNYIYEIHSEDLYQFKLETLGDFEYKHENLQEELHVYSLKQILDYIDLATREAIEICLTARTA